MDGHARIAWSADRQRGLIIHGQNGSAVGLHKGKPFGHRIFLALKCNSTMSGVFPCEKVPFTEEGKRPCIREL